MQLTCPQCGDSIKAENINVQEMVAVCANCNTVFQFELPEAKAKRRKVKKPDNLILHDGENIKMRFRTNWRLESNEQFIMGSTMGAMLTFVSVILMNEYLANEVPLVLPVGFGIAAFVMYYLIALTVYNQTHIEMDEEKIQVYRAPLVNPLAERRTIQLADVAVIRCEETAKSVKEQYDTPRYRVYAETVDKRQKLIATDVVEEYGYFIAQRLDEYLQESLAMDISRLEDENRHESDYQVHVDTATTSMSSHTNRD